MTITTISSTPRPERRRGHLVLVWSRDRDEPELAVLRALAERITR